MGGDETKEVDRGDNNGVEGTAYRNRGRSFQRASDILSGVGCWAMFASHSDVGLIQGISVDGGKGR